MPWCVLLRVKSASSFALKIFMYLGSLVAMCASNGPLKKPPQEIFLFPSLSLRRNERSV